MHGEGKKYYQGTSGRSDCGSGCGVGLRCSDRLRSGALIVARAMVASSVAAGLVAAARFDLQVARLVTMM